MEQAPRYPSQDRPGDDTADYDEGPRPRTHRAGSLLWAAGIALVLAFIALHLTGVLGPGGH